ncbi:MAG TPA: type II toxin-antitoxin system RelE/ParE family toxin [Candidatus Methylacidiphilales bacterium]
MDYKVTFAQNAVKELTEIVTFVARDNPQAARQLGDKLLEQAAGLRRFPNRYARYPHFSAIRKMPVPPYLIYYRINESKQQVTILHFWHGTRQHPVL